MSGQPKAHRGLSPRARGNPRGGPVRAQMPRSIPAGAGEPRAPLARRGCAGHVGRGLSPRARGNPATPPAAAAAGGSIPAGAGEPPVVDGLRCRRRVYPRGRGGTQQMLDNGAQPLGLSPRARGNPWTSAVTPTLMGSIPAGAGEPIRRRSARSRPEVYPRGRGGTFLAGNYKAARRGLSPRARGNPVRSVHVQEVRGSIPAGAGEPPPQGLGYLAIGVYPRGRGGTAVLHRVVVLCEGLSPRARGNRGRLLVGDVFHGSIPAGAGEPAMYINVDPKRRVYPRGRGGTVAGAGYAEGVEGLSPRARGNRLLSPPVARPVGSIPAGAGEPSRRRAAAAAAAVYPRGRGGTTERKRVYGSTPGLSPRARGNLA